MSKYASSGELAAKADWEGGLDEMIFGYGLELKDLPDDMPAHIVNAIAKVLDVSTYFEQAQDYLNTKLENYHEV